MHHDTRPSLVCVLNSLAPYRRHLQRRLARELSGYRIHTLLTHESPDDVAGVDAEPIGLHRFGVGQPATLQGQPARQWGEWQKGGRIIRWLQQNRPAAVIVSTYNDLGRVRLICWCRRNRVPVFLSGDSNARGDRRSGLKSVVKRQVLRWLLGQCQAVLPFGRLGKMYFESYDVPSERIFFFPCEPDYGLIENLPADAVRETARRYGLGQGRRRFIYCGRLAREKRVDLLLDAFAAVAGERPDWDLLIVGEGPLRQVLEHRVPGQLTHRVTWTGSIADPRTIAALYRLSDVLVLPSDYEPWGLVVNEAAAAGLALVCSDVVGAAHELLRDGGNGRLFEHGIYGALVEALRQVSMDENCLHTMKRLSLEILRSWRADADPVRGLQRALEAAGIDHSSSGGPR